MEHAGSLARRYVGLVRRWARSVLLVLVVALAACGARGLSRDQLYQRYVDDLTNDGVPNDIAQCVIEHLFDPMSDVQLKAFNTKGDALTQAQMAQVERLAAQCASSTSA
jgi:hypothetical protein